MSTKLNFVLIWVTPMGQSGGLICDGIEFILVHNISRGWELPGGRIEKSEDFLQAAHRELLEETGISVGKIKDCNFDLYDDGVLVWVEVDKLLYPEVSWSSPDKCITEVRWWDSHPEMKTWDIRELDRIAKWIDLSVN